MSLQCRKLLWDSVSNKGTGIVRNGSQFYCAFSSALGNVAFVFFLVFKSNSVMGWGSVRLPDPAILSYIALLLGAFCNAPSIGVTWFFYLRTWASWRNQNKTPSLITVKSSEKILTKATFKPDGKGKLDLMFKFQDIFTVLILAYGFWISECCWVCHLEEKGEGKEAIYSSLSLCLQ